MQVAQKARAAGSTCQVADIFRCKTISIDARSLGEVTQSCVRTPEELVEEPLCPTSTPQPFLEQLPPKQLSMLISQSQDPDAYNCRMVCQITSRTEPVDLVRVADSWQQAIQRHGILRTIFMGNVTGTGYHDQVVLKEVTADIDMLGRIEDTATMEKAFGAGVPFPGRRQPMHRLTLWSVPASDAFFKLEISHTLIDGISMDIILRDISRAYNGQLRGSPGLQYGDYIAMLQSQSDEPNRHYWDGDKAEWNSLSLDIELDSTWWNYCEAHSATSAQIFQVAWGLVLRCYTGCDQVCFGYLNSGRDIALSGVDDGVGPLINLLVSRMLLDPVSSLRQVMQQSQADYSQALGHQHFALADVFHTLNLSGNALFNTGMSLYRIQSGKEDNAPASTISLKTIDGGDNPEHDVAVLIGTCEDIATVTFTCRTKIISGTDIAKLGEAFREATSVIIATDPDSLAWAVVISQYAGSDNVLLHVMDVGLEDGKIGIVGGIFNDAQLGLNPPPLSYRKLEAVCRSHNLLVVQQSKSKVTNMAKAHEGVGFALVVACRQHVAQRFGYQLSHIVGQLMQMPTKRIGDVRTLSPRDIEQLGQWNSTVPTPAELLLYAPGTESLYTSNWMRKPKGVVINHTSYITDAKSQDHFRFIRPSSRALQFALYMFDVSVADYLRTLLAGGCVCVPREDELKDNLEEVIRRLRVKRMDITPSVLRLLSPEAIPSVKTITVGGEALTRKDVERWSQNMQLINCYSPAECSYCVTASQILSNRSDPVNIGRGLGAICWVIDPDDYRKLVPIGAVGELVVEGPLVGGGYLHNH
ncbi:nonribosomal peptide synthase [Penicillium desertorum]|uniref:Nonribosomal peptide synthase n=1 Tax=Penicillium desertorum TaxID=1303715 RepID=A0A9X0BN38_9EURO|nr:nonribosomal peptide synthase [Penicillium desertorum]